VHEAVRLIADQNVERTEQRSIHPVGFYTGRRVPGDEWIDWNWTSERIYNFVRAITDPGPCARTMVAGVELQVVRAALLPEAPTYLGTAGEVVGRDGGTLHVKSGDSTIALMEIRGEPPTRLRIGSRFHSPPDARVTELERRIERLERAIEQRSDA
jgi:methionyl-tRNA formyltransferase